MSIEVLRLRAFTNNNTGAGIDIAFPVLAFECEVSFPVEKEIDAYEEAVLKFISIGLTKNNIQRTLKITQSLCGSIFANLEIRGYIIRKTENNYSLMQKAENVLSGTEIPDSVEEAKFGYMFASSIKKEPLWYFHEGDIFNAPRSDLRLLENKLTKGKNEDLTFETFNIPPWKIEKSFSAYTRIIRILEKKEKGEISGEETVELFSDIESDLSEVYPDNNAQTEETANSGANTLFTASGKPRVRKLKRSPKKLFLQMRIIFDPSVPGGFLVESPFDLYGNDNEFFLRQIQWMKITGNDVYIGENKFPEFMINEIQKLFPDKTGIPPSTDSSVYIISKLPLLYVEKDKYSDIYEDIRQVFELMHQENESLLVKENIIAGFNKKLIERLMDRLFRTVSEENRQKTSRQAYGDFKDINNREIMIRHFAEIIKVDRNILPTETKLVFSAIKKLRYTFGNSIYEKMLNLIVIHYYQTSGPIRKFFQSEGIEDYLKTLKKLNKIRNSSVHATDIPLNDADYNYYIEHVCGIANRLLEALKEE